MESKGTSKMKLIFENPSTELLNRNIRPSHQRIKVLEYLIKNQCHPTVDQVFRDLQSEIPTLSKSTIYNTLYLFLEAGLIRVITIEDNETRYEIITETHGHFKCQKCGAIFDFDIDIDSLATGNMIGFKVIEKNVYFKGICPKCLININHNGRKENNL